MPPPEDDALREVAEAIADGREVPWSTLETSAEGVPPSVLKELQILATLADLHRTSELDAGDQLPGQDAPGGASPATWGPFELKEQLGRGSFGTVFRARDPRLDRDVAVKLVPASDPAGQERIVAEGRRMARVRHPNVITVFGADVFDGMAGIWMDLLEGRTLHDELRERGPFGAREAAVVGIELCQALAAVHRAGLVHRDVKTQNVMREAGGRIVLMDFGAGREQTGPAGQAGTPLYMAPELLDGAEATPVSDLYSLGVLLFYLATGEFPATAGNMEELKAVHASGGRRRLRDVRPDLPPAFIRAVERTIAPDPDDRPATAAALEQDLEAVVLGGDRPARTRPAWASRSRITLVSALLLVLSLVGWNTPLVRDLVSPPSRIRTVAVLPFANLTGNGDQDYLADGMTYLLISDLEQFRSLRVISRTSSMAYKGTDKPRSAVARELGIDGLIEGSIEQSGDQLRISVRLLRPGGSRVWSEVYERPAVDIFKTRGEIVETIASRIRLSRSEEEQRGLPQDPGVALQAQEAFLRGWHRLYDQSSDGIKAAYEALTEAVRLDPRSARAHALLSEAYTLMGSRGLLSSQHSNKMALFHANRAIQLDERISEAHAQLAETVFYSQWNWEWARFEYQRALDLNANNSHAMARYSQFLSALRQSDDAIRLATEAQQRDPLRPSARSAPGMAYFYARDYNRAIEEFERLKEIPPYSVSAADRVGLARAYAQGHRYAEAIAELRAAIGMESQTRQAAWAAELAIVYALAGNTAEARAILKELYETGQDSARPANVGLVHIALGELNRGFELLDIAATRRAPALLWAHVDPRFDSVRQDPRFVTLLDRIGLPY